jgi:hypothetical protein
MLLGAAFFPAPLGRHTNDTWSGHEFRGATHCCSTIITAVQPIKEN